MSGVLNELARFISAPGAEALKALLNSKGFIPVPLGAITQEDGTALLKQATTVAGYSQLSDKETVINIPVNCTAGEALGFVVPTPIDLDSTKPVEVCVLIGKAANNDALTLDCEVFSVGAGDTANADIQLTAATAITAAASKLVFTCSLSGMLPPPGGLSVVLTLGGTNDQDATYIYSVWVEYTKCLLNE
jgi:hypothetical protein